MYKSLLAASLLIIAATATATTAHADPYRYCAELGGGGEGSFTNSIS